MEDNVKSSIEASKIVRRARLRPIQISTQEKFVDALSTLESGACAPTIVILDLRLPWAPQPVLVDNAIAGGLGCLELLRQEPLTAHVPVVIFSAFIHDEIINRELAVHQPVSLVDKMEAGRLSLVIQNLLPAKRPTASDKLAELVQSSEHRLLRIAAVIGAVTVIAGAVLWLAKFVE